MRGKLALGLRQLACRRRNAGICRSSSSRAGLARSVTSRLIEACAGAGRGAALGATATTFSGTVRCATGSAAGAAAGLGAANAPVMRWNRFGARLSLPPPRGNRSRDRLAGPHGRLGRRTADAPVVLVDQRARRGRSRRDRSRRRRCRDRRSGRHRRCDRRRSGNRGRCGRQLDRRCDDLGRDRHLGHHRDRLCHRCRRDGHGSDRCGGSDGRHHLRSGGDHGRASAVPPVRERRARQPPPAWRRGRPAARPNG